MIDNKLYIIEGLGSSTHINTIYDVIKYPIIGAGIIGLGYYIGGISHGNGLLVDLVSKFDKGSGYKVATLKHYILAKEYFSLAYESTNLEYFTKFLSNSGLTLGYSMASIYSESVDLISGLVPENVPFINEVPTI